MTQDWPIDFKIGYGKPIGILAKMNGDETMKLYPSKGEYTMNERIEKLSEQCQLETYGINGELLASHFDAQKFAELIVRECISVINTEAAEVPVEDEYERMWKMGTEFAVYQIGKHFGVEE